MRSSIQSRLRLALGARALSSLFLLTSIVSVPSIARANAVDEPVAAGQLTNSSAQGDDATPDAEPESKKYGRAKIGFIAPSIGYLFYPRSELEVRGFKAIVDPRNGLIAKAGLALGGTGIGFELTPIFSLESGGINTDSEGFGNLNIDVSQGLAGANLFGVGAQMQLVFRLPIKRVVLSAGLGLHGTYLFGEDIDYGTELYGRIPLAVDVYFTPRIAVFAQFAFMSGVTGIKMPFILPDTGAFATIPFRAELEMAQTPEEVQAWYAKNEGELEAWAVANRDQLPEGYDPQDVATDFVKDQISQSIRFGKGVGMEFAIGFRF